VLVGENSPAHPQHHRAVPPHQRFKGCVILLREEALEQFTIVLTRGGPGTDHPEGFLNNLI
jgi:hypothetical protein